MPKLPVSPNDEWLDDFRLEVVDVFDIAGRGTFASGHLRYGSIQIGQSLVVHSAAGPRSATCQDWGLMRVSGDLPHEVLAIGVGTEIEEAPISPGDVVTAASNVSLPGQRGDIRNALWLLSDRELHDMWRAGESTSSSLTDAVHWLVDDTWLDTRPAADLVPDVLRSNAEADALDLVVALLLRILDELGGVAPVTEYVESNRWPAVVEAAAAAQLTLSARTTE